MRNVCSLVNSRAAACGLAVILLTFAAALTGCNSTYRGGYDYRPRPVDLEIGSGARMVLTINGIRRAEKGGLGDAVEAVIRFDNERGPLLRIDPRGLTLITANMLTLEADRVEPVEAVTLAAGQSQTVTAWFELPQGENQPKADLDGLSLRVVVRRGEDSITRSATFSLDRPENRRSNVGFGVGVGIGL